MGTKGTRSAGAQYNPKGVTQGNTLVDPNTGLPVDVITDNDGTRRLAVDAAVTLDSATVNVDLDYTDDSVQIGDPNTSSTLKINPDGSIDSNVFVDSADGDNIAIKDSAGDELNINPDGSINVVIAGSGGIENVISSFNAVTSVASATPTLVASYTVPMSKTANMQRIEVSGTNIAAYDIQINTILQARQRTYFGNSLNLVFDFFTESSKGLLLNAGDVIEVYATHNRPNLGDFEARIQVIENG